MRNWRIELLRGLAAFGIVGCHLALSPRTHMGYAVGSFCDMNVGVFAALSGYLMSTNVAWLDYVWRRIRRLVPTYVAWTVLFILYGLVFDCLIRHGINPKWHRDGFVWRVVFLGDAATHLWFLACLLYAQVIASALFRLLKCLPKCIWIVVGFAFVMITVPVGGFWGRYFLRLFGFLLTGYGLGVFAEHQRHIPLGVIPAVTICAALFHWFGREICSGFVLDWLLAVPLLLLFIGKSDDKSDGNGSWIAVSRFLGETSFGVFLIHPAVTAAVGLLVRRLTHAPYGVNWVLADWLVSWSLTFAFVVLMRRQAKLRWLIM